MARARRTSDLDGGLRDTVQLTSGASLASTARLGLVMPMRPAMPPAATSAAQMTTTWWNARTDSSFAAKVSPTSVPATTTPTTRDADQSGDAGDGVVDRGRDAGVGLVGIGEHGGRERGDRHRQARAQKRSSAGSRSVRYDGVDAGSEQEQEAGCRDERPGPMKRRGPWRSASAPKRRESANMTSVTGSVASPLSSAL